MAEPTMADLLAQIESLKAQLAERVEDQAILASGETPKYELIEPFYCDDTLWPVGAILDYDGWPNEFMTPLNEPARAKMKIILAGISKIPLAEQIRRAKEELHARDRAASEPLTAALIAALGIRAGDQGALVQPGTHQMDTPDPRPAVAAEPSMPRADKSVPIRGDLALPGQRRRGRPKSVKNATIPPEDGRPKGPERIMGTIVTQNQGAIVTGTN